MNQGPTTADNITLIGMPASGKSTLGVLLAKRLGLAFTDTDLIIQTGENCSLPEIIRKRGIEAFCDLEAAYVQRLQCRRTVIATGGSVVYRPAAMAHLRRLGCIVFLDVSLSVLSSRLEEMDARGVVRTPGQTIARLYAERRPLYLRHAHLKVDCTNVSPEAALKKVITTLEENA